MRAFWALVFVILVYIIHTNNTFHKKYSRKITGYITIIYIYTHQIILGHKCER